MNKTHTVTELPCGCVKRRWLFGFDYVRRCRDHQSERPVREWSKGDRKP